MSADKTDEQRTDGEESAGNRAPAGDRKKPWLHRIPVVSQALTLYQSYSRRNGPLLSAGIAYYGVFALAPLMLLTLQISGHIVGRSTAQQELKEALEAILGPKLADVLSGVAVDLQGTGSTVATVVGAALLLYAATRLFLRLQASFDVMWDVQVSWAKSSQRRFLSRLVTFGMILVPALLLVVSLFLNAGISWLEDILGTSGVLLSVAQALIPFLVSWGALVAIFTILPDVRISWRDCWLGALFTGVLCAVGARVFGLYLSWSTSQKYAGAVGALLALIVWVDFMAVITLLGARLNRLLYEWRGKTVRPYSFVVLAADDTGGQIDEADPPMKDEESKGDASPAGAARPAGAAQPAGAEPPTDAEADSGKDG